MKKLTPVIALLMTIVILFCGCNMYEFGDDSTVEDTFDTGIHNLVNGRTEDYGDVDDPGMALDELIEKYGGGFSLPEAIEDPSLDPVFPDDPDPVVPDDPDPVVPDDPDPVTPDDPEPAYPTVKSISNVEDLAKAAEELYVHLDTRARAYKLEGGYTVTTDDIYDAMELVSIHQPLLSIYMSYWSHDEQIKDNKNYFSLQITYAYSTDKIKSLISETKEKAKEIEKELKLSSLSDYEKVLAVNDYLCKNCKYQPNKVNGDYTVTDHTAYGALLTGICVCDGYSRAACLLLTDAGMECMFVIGDAGGGHAWNMVKVDGKWYQLDITWNDGSEPPSKDYFLVDDKYMSASRTWNRSFYPKCNSGKYKSK